jgi:hypothetical protein
MMPSDFEIIDLIDKRKLIRDTRRNKTELECFNCHKIGWWTWYYIGPVLFNELSMLCVCNMCSTKIAKFYQINENQTIDGRMVDTT